MSTKMYNLYRTTMNLSQLDAWLQALKERHLESLVYRIAPFAKKLDLWETINVITGSTKQGLRSPLNIDASVVIYIDGSKLYVQFFGVDSDLYENEVQEGLLADFHYQDSADKPDNVTKQEWSKRYKVIDRILSKDDTGIPSQCGFCRVLTDEQNCTKVAEYVRQYLESTESH